MWQTVGQDKAVFLLQRSLETNQLANAYLFIGPKHVGKATLAINLAQALNCGTKEPPCGQCLSCRKILSGTHADVRMINIDSLINSRLRSEIGIDQIRELQHSASLPPFEGKYKVFIIDDAGYLSLEAANCLLKTLEEAVGKLLFILLATNERLVLPTIISRCQQIELPPVPTNIVAEALQEYRHVEASKASSLATLSRGRLGWAFSAASDESIIKQRTDCIRNLINIVKSDYVDRFAVASQLTVQFNQAREVIYELFELWLHWWRDLLLVNVKNGEMITFMEDYAQVTQIAACFSISQIKDVIRSIENAERQLRQNANSRLVLEMLLLSMPRLSNTNGW